MAETTTPNPPVALHDDQDLWLVSYSDDDDREMSALQIAAALSRGEIDANTIVWRDGMSEWKAIAEVDVLKEQLRQVSASPENPRKRQTQIGGFGPAQPYRGSTPAAPTPATQLPYAAPVPAVDADDDEPTIVQPAFAQAFGSSPNNATPGPAPSRSRHPTSGNTLRIRTGGEPVTMRTPTPTGGYPEPDVAEPELESIPSALLITATNNTEVEEAVNAVKQRNSTTPPLPTRGVMSRSSDPPHNKVSSNLPRAALTRDGESDSPGPTPRITDAPKPPVPKRSLAEGVDSLSPDDVKSESESSAPDANGPATPRYNTPLASVQIRDDVDQVYSADLQKTRPPRSRREPLLESGTPPPFGELAEVASRMARTAQSQAPVVAPPSERQPRSSGGRMIGWLLFGAAAVAGAFTLGKRSTDLPPEGTTPNAGMQTSAGAVAANATAVTPETSGLAGAELAATGSSPTTSAADSTYISLATKPTPPAVAPGAAKGITAPSARPTAIKPTVPALSATPSAGTPASANTPANATPGEQSAAAAPGAFDSSAAANALALAANKASSCRQPGDPSGIARVTVTFTNSGKSTHALVDGPPFAGTATGGCIASTMRSTSVPAFIGDRVTVKKTVVIQ